MTIIIDFQTTFKMFYLGWVEFYEATKSLSISLKIVPTYGLFHQNLGLSDFGCIQRLASFLSIIGNIPPQSHTNTCLRIAWPPQSTHDRPSILYLLSTIMVFCLTVVTLKIEDSKIAVGVKKVVAIQHIARMGRFMHSLWPPHFRTFSISSMICSPEIFRRARSRIKPINFADELMGNYRFVPMKQSQRINKLCIV